MSTGPEFTAFPKLARTFRQAIISEKIDGTNAAVGVFKFQFGHHAGVAVPVGDIVLAPYLEETPDGMPEFEYLVYAQSRKQIITPDQDNHGFARWVHENASDLAGVLGEGLHFGEWWGNGIQRGYGLLNGDKRFSLFNTPRWRGVEFSGAFDTIPALGVVPVLYIGEFDTEIVRDCVCVLRDTGSRAAPGFMKPEGVVVFHKAANMAFKTTLEKDEMSKGEAQKMETNR